MKLSYVLLAALIAAGAYTAAFAQYQPPQFQGDWGRIFGRTDNPNLACQVQRRIDRNGDIIWLQMICRAIRGERDR